MKNIVVTNAYLNTRAFIDLKSALQNAFDEDTIFLTNDKAYALCEHNGNGQPILFFDKDIILCQMLEKSGYKPINSSKVIETCDDKAKTFAALYGFVSMPKTYIAPFTYENIGYTDFDFIIQAEKKCGYPMIVKEGKGSFGKQVFKVGNREELISVLEKLQGKSIVLQEFIAESAGKDLRVYVVGGKAVACAERINKNDFRSNVQSGGIMRAVDLNNMGELEEYAVLAEKTANLLGCCFAGVDILFSNNGPMLCEVNSNAHFTALSQATGVDVAKKIAEYYNLLKK